MKKIKNFFKNNVKVVAAFVIGILISCASVYAATIIGAGEVSYTNNSQTSVQSALDDLYQKASNAGGNLGDSNKFIEAYTYNASTCVTGNESTCVKTECYKTKSANSCPAGTIIRYKVRPGEVVTFHVMYDDASTITMQAQRNTVYNTAWMTKEDYVAAGGTEDDYGTYGNDHKGPITILTALERATAGWSNVNDITYTAGETIFKTNAYTKCDNYFASSCNENYYTLESRTVKARLITIQEVGILGCKYTTDKSCPIWMYNYLKLSTSYGGTENDTSYAPIDTSGSNNAYWTMSTYPSASLVWGIYQRGRIAGFRPFDIGAGARAVVQVSK